MQLDNIQIKLLKDLANIDHLPSTAHMLRENGAVIALTNSEDVSIVDVDRGKKVIIKEGAKTICHVPVLVTQDNFIDKTYIEFDVGANAVVEIVAGCGIHNRGRSVSQHNAIHVFNVGANAKVKYVERHLGDGTGVKNLSPKTNIFLSENSTFEMETSQIGGVDYATRETNAFLNSNATLKCTEHILTTQKQDCTSVYLVELNGDNAKAQITSKNVAKGTSSQVFKSTINGNNRCFAHVECDGILLDKAKISSIPAVNAYCAEAELVHEASIGKIANEELIKLQTLGLTHSEAEEIIIKSYLK